MDLQYSIFQSARTKRIRISVHSDGGVAVSAPKRISEEYISKLVDDRRAWIEKVVAKYKKMTTGLVLANEVVDKKEFTKKVTELIKSRAKIMAVRVYKISIRKMRSRWGSCSRDGNISINLLLGHLPAGLLDYVVIHELCHLVHHNHSKSFWLLVAAYDPTYKKSKADLKKYGYLLRQKKAE